MTTVPRRAAMIAAIAAAIAVAMAPPGAVLAGEEPPPEQDPVLTIDGTICYEKYPDHGGGKDGARHSGTDSVAYVTLTLSEATKEDVVVVLHTEDGTARSPEDYGGFERLVVRIPAGTTRVEVPITIVEDKEREPDEYFLVIVDGAEGAIVGNEKAEVVIKDGSPPKDPRD